MSTPAETNPEGSSRRSLGGWRAAAMTAAALGALGSLDLTFRAGHRNHSLLLMALFVIWVLAPFVALISAGMVARRWAVPTQATLYSLMLLLAVGSLASYGAVVLGPPRAKPAFVFLVVPLASWLLIAIAAAVARLVSRTTSK